ncbi:pyrophosphatase PpaX [Camelliibacillus cellulosilyticus]|uniref:Pyrophosphatase PpaX n=1 Tax=Camelliibacillus cellulosilyticus TaxID=2174486 RepID=A0ABV9GN00_9BACL
MIDTILFDLDGTLINTNDLIIASYQHTLDYYFPNRYTESDMINFIGEPLETTFNRVDPDRAPEMVRRYRAFNLEKHDELFKEYPNVYDTVKQLKEKGFKLGIVTTKRRQTVLLGLQLAKLAPFFNVVITLDDVKNAKPDPEPVLLALDKLESEAGRALMVGDSPSDIEAGRRAGTQTVGVSWTIKGVEVLKPVRPDYIIDDMAELVSILEQ